MSAPAGWAPDCPLAEAHPSPNHGERANGRAPDMILLHYTGMASGEAALARLCDPAAEVSSHYLVWEDGRIAQLVPEARRAWHAGAGSWAGERDLNSCSIGIEIVNGGHPFGLPPYPPAQIAAVIRLCLDIAARRAIAPARVLAHSDIAPARKEDPGELFPWRALAAAGLGVWVEPEPIRDGPALEPGASGAEIRALQATLARLGYEIAASGTYDEATRLVVTAFQRHFRPGLVDGRADRSTLLTLERLLAAAGAPPDRSP